MDEYSGVRSVLYWDVCYSPLEGCCQYDRCGKMNLFSGVKTMTTETSEQIIKASIYRYLRITHK